VDGEEDIMTETQPGAGPENELAEDATGYADPGAQLGLGTTEPTDDLHVATGYADPGTHAGLGTREPTDHLHE
jgi:hypothetical protein